MHGHAGAQLHALAITFSPVPPSVQRIGPRRQRLQPGVGPQAGPERLGEARAKLKDMPNFDAALQDQGLDTVEANLALGFRDEHRFTSGPVVVRGRW